MELSDGTIYYNSRRHWAPHGTTRRRWSARSRDGGATWSQCAEVPDLPDGPQGDNFGLFGGLDRLELPSDPPDAAAAGAAHDVLIFSNCDDHTARKNGAVWVSVNGGVDWKHKRRISNDVFAYSSLAVGRRHTATEGWIYCFFEGPDMNGSVARFNLSWLAGSDDKTEDEMCSACELPPASCVHETVGQPNSAQTFKLQGTEENEVLLPQGAEEHEVILPLRQSGGDSSGRCS